MSKKTDANKKLLSMAYKDPLVMANRLQALQKDSNGNLLEPVMFKGEGYGTYWSQSDKKFMKIARKSEHYLCNWGDPQDKDAVFVFTYHTAHAGVILRVHKDDVYKIGFN